MSGGIAPLILNLSLDGCEWSDCIGHFTATEKVLVFIELEAGWVLQLVWMIWRRDNSLALAKI